MGNDTARDYWLDDWSLTIKNLLFPIFCHTCGVRLLTEENPNFCPTCWELSPRVERPFCIKCGAPQQGRAGFGAPQNFLCAACREDPMEHVRRLYAAATYDGAIAEAIQLFKFNEKRALAEQLGALLQQFAVQEMDRAQYDCLIPVPLHRVRQRDRGYNQSALLADIAAEVFPDVPVLRVLERVRPTEVQSRIKDSAARQKNVHDAFSLAKEAEIAQNVVLLVDDVVTTGSTVEECARTLLAAGASAVDVLAVAIPVNDDVLPGDEAQ